MGIKKVKELDLTIQVLEMCLTEVYLANLTNEERELFDSIPKCIESCIQLKEQNKVQVDTVEDKGQFKSRYDAMD